MIVPTPPTNDPTLEAAIAAVEMRLVALGDALRARDIDAIDAHATGLHRALASAVDRFAQAARTGSIAPALRSRLATASGRVAAQRESLARATAALDRAIEVLLPAAQPSGSLYGANGGAERPRLGGGVSA